MAAKLSHTVSGTSTSLGHALGEANYLDARFLASRTEYEQMLRWVEIQPGWQVLDAGAGSGAFLPLLCELVGTDGSVTALDLAPENIQACEALVARLKPACSFNARVGNVLRLPFDDDTFDAVWCANTTQYLTDDELAIALAEMKRVTKPGGLVALKEPDTTVIQLAHIDPVVMWRFLNAVSETDLQYAGCMRAIELPDRLRQAGLVNARWRTTLIERFGPMKPLEKKYLGDLLGYMATAALSANVPESDIQIWQHFQQMLQDGQLFDQSDFFFRDCAITAAAEVP